MVGGAAHGIPHDRYRSTNIVVRNSTVHDVYGDGIIVFFAHRAIIERSVAWNTGFQPNYSIGTPNAIWTWMCRECTVQFNEAYLSDSPGFDGGAFDIDWADDDNIVQYNYGHDTQGYCIAVFGAGYTTRNSIVRYNVCANNGLSPRLARLQGAVFVHTWNDGKLDGVEIYNNTIVWNPPIDAPALMSDAEFTGQGPRIFKNNIVLSGVPSFVSVRDWLQLDHNLYWNTRGGNAAWKYAGRTYESFTSYREGSGQDRRSMNKDPKLVSPEYHGIGLGKHAFRLAPGSPAIDAGAALSNMGAHDVFGVAIPQGKGYDIGASEFPVADRSASLPASLRPSIERFKGKWLLVGLVDARATGAAAADSRSLLVQLKSLKRQFRDMDLRVAVAVDAGVSPASLENYRADRQLGDMPLFAGSGAGAGPETLLISPDMRVAARWTGVSAPASMGLALRSILKR